MYESTKMSFFLKIILRLYTIVSNNFSATKKKDVSCFDIHSHDIIPTYAVYTC